MAKSVCFTGKLNLFTRNEASAAALKAGFEVAATVGPSLTYLITNTPDSGSSKNRKAAKYGVKVITEDQFIKMVGLKRGDVEADIADRKANPPKKVVDWETACKLLCKAIGVRPSVRSNVGDDFVTRTYYGGIKRDDGVKYGENNGWLDTTGWYLHDAGMLDSMGYPTEDAVREGVDGRDKESAYKCVCWLLGEKHFTQRNPYEPFASKYSEFGRPGSTEEMKLRIEVNDGISLF